MSKSKQKQPQGSVSEGRRSFLRGMAASSGAAAVAAALPATALAETPEAGTDQTAEGYRLTQHVVDYYKSAAS